MTQRSSGEWKSFRAAPGFNSRAPRGREEGEPQPPRLASFQMAKRRTWRTRSRSIRCPNMADGWIHCERNRMTAGYSSNRWKLPPQAKFNSCGVRACVHGRVRARSRCTTPNVMKRRHSWIDSRPRAYYADVIWPANTRSDSQLFFFLRLLCPNNFLHPSSRPSLRPVHR